MRTVVGRDELRSALEGLPRPLALVPTMGALHHGHASLLALAASRAASVVVSAYVNPLQFADGADLRDYPSTPGPDAALCARGGVGVLWRPTREDAFADETAEPVDDALAGDLEGRDRPGHFVGVATVVRELWRAVGPDLAVFGAKDWQQLAVVRALAARLGGPRIVEAPTVRDPDGLAASSRNVRLSPAARRVALAIPRSLDAARDAAARGVRSVHEIEGRTMAAIAGAGTHDVPVRLHYASVRDGSTLASSDTIGPGARLLVAATVGGVRLIDNAPLA